MRTFFLAVLVSTLAGAALAQSTGAQPPALTAEVDVHVVNVDVGVTDSHGKPILGLNKNDFEVLEDGKPQPITNFSVIRLASDKTVVATAPLPADSRRRILLVVDNNYLDIPERNRALDIVEKYLNESFSGDWAVATVGHNAELMQTFTADKSTIREALARVRKMPTLTSHNFADRRILSDRNGQFLAFTSPDDKGDAIRFGSREQTYRTLMTVQNTARAVVDTARAYAAEPGKKFIILLTGGIELNTTFSAYDRSDDVELREVKLEMAKVVDAMVHEANAANFTIHIVNARTRSSAPQHDVTNRASGINVTAEALLKGGGGEPVDVSDVDSIPLSIALGTGGMYLPSTDLRASIQQIDTDTSSFYSLGYSPAHNGDRQYHTIKVRLKRPGLNVAHRSGYYDDTPEDRLQAMLQVRMTFDREFGSLPVSVEVGHAKQTDRDLVLPVSTAMPLSKITVIPGDQGFVGRVHVYISVFDDNGRNVAFHHQTQDVTVAPEQLSGSGSFRYTMKVHLPKGNFTVVMTLRDELSNEIGSASEAIRL